MEILYKKKCAQSLKLNLKPSIIITAWGQILEVLTRVETDSSDSEAQAKGQPHVVQVGDTEAWPTHI